MAESYYTILGLTPSASIADIKKAYRTLAKKYHPDVNKDPEADEKFIAINEAYRCLLNLRKGINNKHYISYEEWIKIRREIARREAAQHAKMKYEQFRASKLYKTARTVSAIMNYFYIFIGLAIIAIPTIHISINGFDPNNLEGSIAGLIVAIIIGVIFVVVLFATRKDFEF